MPSPIIPHALLALTLPLLFSTTTHGLVPSPEASTSLICHTSHASECYPSIFQPTKDFQRIHDDQSVPPGLHIRMNLETGIKHGRLNIPEEDEGSPAEIVVVDTIQEGESETLNEDVQEALEEEARFKIPPPPEPRRANALSDTRLFHEIKTILLPPTAELTPSIDLSANPSKYLQALENLTDIAHDLEWGHYITSLRLSLILTSLIGAYPLSPSDTESAHIPLEIRSAAALLLGTAIQNNPDALAALLGQFPKTQKPPEIPLLGPVEVVTKALTGCADRKNKLRQLDDMESGFASRLVFLSSQLCSDQKLLVKFIDGGGMGGLLDLFLNEVMAGRGMTRLRTKVVNLVADHAKSIAEEGRVNALEPWCEAFADVLHFSSNTKNEDVVNVGSLKEAMGVVGTVLRKAGGEAGRCEWDVIGEL